MSTCAVPAVAECLKQACGFYWSGFAYIRLQYTNLIILKICIRIPIKIKLIEDIVDMKKALMIASVLVIAVISTACINNIAVQELNNKAAEFMQKGDYESAMNRLQASLDLDSTMYETYYNLGVASINAKKFEKAIEALEGGIKIKPDFADFYYSLGIAQSEYADEIIAESEASAEENKTPAEKINEVNTVMEADIRIELSEAKTKAIEYKKASVENLKKYLEMQPDTKDKETIEALIQESEAFINGDDVEQTAKE